MAILARVVSFTMAGIAAIAMSCSAPAAAEYPNMTIRFGDVGNRNFGYYQGMVAFKDEVESKSGGRIKVDRKSTRLNSSHIL